MPLGTPHLTLETTEQAFTYPGQAHFAIPNATRRCAECELWSPKRKRDKLGTCLAAARMLGKDPRQIPRIAVICKYFEERSSP
jgi:hypothetical protein